MNPHLKTLVASLAVVLVSGCAGYNHTLFVTKTNVGLDLDTQTPTAEVSLARREVVVAPTFEMGQTPPVAASFRVKGAWIASDVSTTFTGGDAAKTVAELYNQTTPTGTAKKASDSTLTLRAGPKSSFLGNEVKLYQQGQIHPLIFGTDTSLGIKAAWSGMTAQYPDSLKVGFHRKEIAVAPVFATRSNFTQNGATATNHLVKIPSFLATTDSGGKTGSITNSQFRYTQYFATGEAADQLALRQEIRDAIAERLDPTAATADKIKKNRDEAGKVAKQCVEQINRLSGESALQKAVAKAQDAGLIPQKTADSLTPRAKDHAEDVKAVLRDACNTIAQSGSSKAEVNLSLYLGGLKSL